MDGLVRLCGEYTQIDICIMRNELLGFYHCLLVQMNLKKSHNRFNITRSVCLCKIDLNIENPNTNMSVVCHRALVWCSCFY